VSDLPYRERLKTEALAIATRIIAEEGLAALQARRVATEAGCSVGSIYNVFGDLDGLIIAANSATIAMLGNDLAESFKTHAGQPTQARLMDLALAYMRFAIHHLNRWKAVFEHRLMTARDIPESYRADQARLLELIEKIIAAEIPDGALRVHAGRALFASVHGIITLALDAKLQPFNRKSLEQEIRFIVRAAANGLKAAL
jgi:AcrR family transcriptional regulator